jgi:predicted amidophosphoribosyltransferase
MVWQAINAMSALDGCAGHHSCSIALEKFRKRGYNQSAVFGEGIGEAMGIPCSSTALRRVTHDKSLTGMKRLERVQTIGASYRLAKPHAVKNKHVMIVDDVLTTGSTLEGLCPCTERCRS